jgi:tetratricopeptide (TPR) repeat protein
MSTSAPIDPQTPGTPPAADAPVAPDFELTLRKFWEKYAKIILLTCAAVLVVILAQGGLKFFRAAKEKEIAAAYANASTSERLKSFAAEHPDHLLGAAAMLRLADEAYAAGQYSDAVTQYQKAAAIFKSGPFGGRALLGAAISKIKSAQASEGEAQLKQLADDTAQPKVIRAEAAYHLAAHVLDAGRTDDAIKHLDLVNSIDPTSNWARLALMIRATLSTPTPTPAASLLPTTVKP